MNEQFQNNLLRLQADLHTRLRNVRDVRKALVYGLRTSKDVFRARQAAIATLKPGRSGADLVFAIPKDADWDIDMLTRYISGGRPEIPRNILLAPVGRRGRNWGVLALKDGEFTSEHRQGLFSITQILTDIIQVVDQDRTNQVRRKIERKIADREEPKDLIYDILHGLRSLTYYDHSASLLISRDGGQELTLVAEQIAWTKAKSKRIGLRLRLQQELSEQLRRGGVYLYQRRAKLWHCPAGSSGILLPQLLDYHAHPGVTAPREVAMVCAPIATPDGTLGVLKISSRREGVLGDHEAGLIADFVPLTSLAVQFSVRTESLKQQILQSERKHALANLTRGITHDVNNALGAVLPLVQQMQEDTRTGRMAPSVLTEDLGFIEKSIQTCRRIFDGMLAIARGSSRGIGHGNLRRAIHAALSVLEDSLKRHSIQVSLDLPQEIPTIRGSQGDLTQVFLNIFSNSRDAMPRGGLLTIKVQPQGDAVLVEVKDTGCGMPADVLDRILEPFFTTKPEGSGLGLSICRSVLWDIGGDWKIDSKEGQGTRVRLRLPVLESSTPEQAA